MKTALQQSIPVKAFACSLLLLVVLPAAAHPVNIAMEKAPTQDVVWFYMKMGILHIIPNGFDHILFVVSLCLLSNKIKVILWQATAFTMAHSVTLALSMKGIIAAPPPVIEPIISISIVFVAIENMLLSELKPWRVIIVFFFGLVHGMGFASALNEVGLPRNNFYTSILSFNAGVELGQIAIILLVFFLLINPLGKKVFFRKQVVYPLSACIAVIAGYWTIERLFM
ncbi:MAG TPA: HupE/UreJ family protein [Panacibacter sp.]|nr:HupE/UreJ family protein [Panacibacter sp.]HNP44283.1 HupE/UreJ family protein [Panacibacter sp.]